MAVQMELELELNPIDTLERDVMLLQKQAADIRKSFFARMNAMERVVEEVRLENEGLKRDIEALRLEVLCQR